MPIGQIQDAQSVLEYNVGIESTSRVAITGLKQYPHVENHPETHWGINY